MINLNFKINFKKLYKIIPTWTWVELSFALIEKIIKEKDIIFYANQIIEENIANFELVLNLSIAYDYEVEKKLLELILYEENKKPIEKIHSKWAFACIYYGYIYNLGNIYDIIEDVYCEFNNIEELEHMISYMPYIKENPRFNIKREKEKKDLINIY